ncbi:TRAP transporter small permease [Modicisalibacter radicis]|uniref:TRAP transporter small permease n=1 Tax=Halomonas sp. EAR18 TaxID=2518972 RepID=UPI001FCEE770|nr:TRAP transporter small permease [Halomonas sp. EAR18]
MLRKAVVIISRSLFYIAVVGGMFMAALVFVSTIMRYLFGAPISFSDELAGLLFFSLAFMTLPHVMLEKKHVSIDFISKSCSPKIRSMFSVLASLVMIVFAVVFIYESWDFMRFSYQIDAKSDIGSILLWPWMLLMPLSMGLCLVIKLLDVVSVIRPREK